MQHPHTSCLPTAPQGWIEGRLLDVTSRSSEVAGLALGLSRRCLCSLDSARLLCLPCRERERAFALRLLRLFLRRSGEEDESDEEDDEDEDEELELELETAFFARERPLPM